MYIMMCDGGRKRDYAYGSFKVWDDEGEELPIPDNESWLIFDDITSNESEYAIFVKGLDWLLEHNITKIIIYSDSALVVNQILGEWECKHDHLQAYLTQIREREVKFEKMKVMKVTGKLVKHFLGH
jgi:ribonuclease HI